MSNKNPCNAGKGRGKGNLNKNTAAIKEMIEGALKDAGGQAYLTKQANENPAAFMGLLGKILPKDVNLGGQGGGPIIVEMVKRIVDPKRDT